MREALTVAYYAPSWPLDFGPANGIVSYVASMKRAMELRGHRVLVVTGRLGPGADPETTIEVPQQPPSPAARVRRKLARAIGAAPDPHADFARRLGDSLARRDGLDIVEVEESFGFFREIAAAVACPAVMRLHGPWFKTVQIEGRDPQAPENARRLAAEADAFRKAGAATAPTRAVLDGMIAQSGYRPPIAQTIFNPVEIPDQPLEIDATNANAILFVGRTDACKGIDLALGAFDRVARDHPAATLTVIGADRGLETDEGTVHFDELAKQLVHDEARARITYLGPLPRSEVQEHRHRHGITLIASRYENLPYAATEAMAIGSAVVSTSYAGVEEIIEHGRTGLVAPGCASETLAEALGGLVGQPGRQQALGTAARAFAQDELSLQALGQKTEDLYRTVISRFGTGD